MPGAPISRTPFGIGAAEALVLRGVLQEVDDLDQLVLGLVDPGDIVEGDLRLLLAVALGAAAAEAEQPAAAAAAARRLIQTKAAISSSVGPKLISSFNHDEPLSIDGLDDDAFLLEQRSRPGSAKTGRCVLNFVDV